MTRPIDDEGVDVPLRLQPVVARQNGWRGRSGSLVAVGLVAFVLAAVALGTALDNGFPASSDQVAAASLPSSATPRPSSRPTPTRKPLASALPTMQVLGSQIPTERRLVNANGLERLDLASGELIPQARQLDYSSIPLPLPNDELVCACIVREVKATATGSKSIPRVRFGRYDEAGEPIVERDLLSLEGVVEVPDMTEGFNVTIGVDPGGRTMAVVVVERRPPVWTIALSTVDVDTGEVLTTVDLDQVPVDFEEPAASASPRPGGRPPDGIYLWAYSAAVAPDAHTVFVSIGQSEVRNENWSSTTLDWMVELDPGKPAAVTPLTKAASIAPDGWCLNQPIFIDAKMLAQVCGGSAEGGAGSLYVRRIGPDGETLGDVPIDAPPFDGGYPVSVVVDRSQRAAFLWHLQRHVLVRVDLDAGQISEAEVPESMLPDGGLAVFNQGYIGGDPGLVLSPDGRRLYAIGVAGTADSAVGGPSGIWVFEPDSLKLVDHWEPRAFLSSLAVSKDGRFVYAAGAAGYDVEGRENPWPASVTVYDAATGAIQRLFGAVIRDTWISFVALP